ncbi:MAG: hypothetical protein JWM47_1448 [Acidimicrobiales bacterium]|nr:hypothetical protein [Acidimicrobiales bacterium]
MTPAGVDGGSDRFDADLRAITDQQRALDAAQARRREHNLRAQAGEAGNFVGVLADLGEGEQPVAMSTGTGRVLRGVIRTLGSDFVGLRGPGGDGTLVSMAAICAVRSEPGRAPTMGDRMVQLTSTLGGVLGDLASERPWLTLHTTSGDALVGRLVRVGLDVVVLRTQSDGSGYVPLAKINDVVLP